MVTSALLYKTKEKLLPQYERGPFSFFVFRFSFKAIADKESPPIINNIMPIVSSIKILTLAYHRIRPNAGAMTPGTQSQTADEFCNSRVHSLSEQLANGTYNFPDVRRKWTPKPGKGTAQILEGSKESNTIRTAIHT